MGKTKRIRTFYWLIGALTAILIVLIGILIMSDKKSDESVKDDKYHPDSVSTEQDVPKESLTEPDGTEELLTAKYLYGGTGPTLKSAGKTNYRPENMIDNDQATCWAIDKKSLITDGNHRGEDCVVSFEVSARTLSCIVVYNGYQKNSYLYKANSRPKYIMITLGEKGSRLINRTIYEGILADTFGPQVIRLPETIEIQQGEIVNLFVDPDDIYAGEKYTDICLSDINFYGKS